MLKHSYLKEIISYCPETGIFTWLVKRNSHRGKVVPGSIANSVSVHGYARIGIDGSRYPAHRLAWFYVYGRWPSKQIDHINRDRLDNRIVNLREATDAENRQNMSLSVTNTSGVKGVSWDKRRKKWFSKITHNYQQISLGFHDNINDAEKAYAEAKERLHSFNPGVE